MKIAKINHISFTFKEKLMWASTVIALIVIFFVSLYFSYLTYHSMVIRGESFVSERSDSMKQRITATLDEKFAVLSYIASLPEIYEMNAETQQQYLKDKVDSIGFKYMFIVRNDYSTMVINRNTSQDHADAELFKMAIANYKYISDPYTDSSDDPFTILTVSIFDEKDKKVGALCAALSLSSLYAEMKKMYSTGIVAAITQNGEYVLYEDVSSIVSQANALNTYADSPEAVEFISRGLDSPKTLSGHIKYHDNVYYVAMSDLNYCHWKIIYIMEDDLIMRGVWNILIIQSIAIVMMVLAFILIFGHQYSAIRTKNMAYTDPLTGLGNAQKCHEMLNYFNELNDPIMLICFDLNKFKEINDTLGHQVGDDALKAFSLCLKKSFGTEGYVGRIGGDEFISLLSGDVRAKYDKSIQALNEEIEKNNSMEDAKFKLSVSHGTSVRISDNMAYKPINAMYYEADKAMYEHKKQYHESLR
ncbi:diguanylate cyclase (GGDEF) domain-containing protein [Lachnospiraceae bacterium JC7]|nr:diguanylate cyclase (GGDEF) domain-containing protein [Lachnospiraceae bacterium JC7]